MGSKWQNVRLGDVAEIKHGYAFKGNFFCDTPTKYLLVTPGNFAIGGGFQEKPKYYNGPIPENYVLAKRDLIITMTDLSKQGDTLGFSALIPSSDRYLHNQRIGLVMIKSENIILKEYVYWIMRTWDYQRYIVNHASGSTVKHTSPKTILSYEITLPPLPTQRVIAATLSCLDAKIEMNNRINANLEAQAQAIFKSWFVDFEPWGGIMPNDWITGTISDIASDIICGKTPSTKSIEYFGDDVPFITIPDMHGKVYITSTERSLSKDGSESQRSKTVPPNSVCVSCIATAGLVALTSVHSQTNQQINTIICKDAISPFFVYLTMVRMSDYIMMLGSSGSTTNNLNKRQFSKIELLIPKNGDVDDFSTIVEPLFEKIKCNQQESTRLAAIRDALLPRLMSGEIEVADFGSINDNQQIQWRI